MPRHNLKKAVAHKIKEFRLREKLTQEQVAEGAGIHYKYYQKIESGTVNLTLDTIEKIAGYLDVHPKNLLS